jgi:glutamate 5-kinase
VRPAPNCRAPGAERAVNDVNPPSPALKRGSRFLPAGVTAVEGSFERGDAVLVRAPDGTTVAKGLAAFDAADAKALVGRRTDEIERILGYRGPAEMVHRDDLVLL